MEKAWMELQTADFCEVFREMFYNFALGVWGVFDSFLFMNEFPQTPPPAQTPTPGHGATPEHGSRKKGLSPIAWIGIGCGGLLLLSLILLIGGSFWLFGVAKDLGADFQKNPERAQAELIIKFTPEFTKVSTDEVAGTITFETDGGEVKTLTFDQINAGQMYGGLPEEEIQDGEVIPVDPTTID